MQRAIWSRVRKLSAIFVLIGLGTGMSAMADEQIKRPISIIISPKTKSFHTRLPAVVEVAITNNTKDDLWFVTCPLPYVIQVSRVDGRIIEIGRRDPNDEIICYSTMSINIKPDETSTREVTINDRVTLKPGFYDVEITWNFPVNVIRTQGVGYDADILSVRSNKITISVAEK
jgi:hypothetical protein